MVLSGHVFQTKKGTIIILLAFWPQILNFNSNNDSCTRLLQNALARQGVAGLKNRAGGYQAPARFLILHSNR